MTIQNCRFMKSKTTPWLKKFQLSKKGNFLIHLFKTSYALLIIDSEMKTILWSKDLSKMKYGLDQLQFETHYDQVTKDGQILLYVNVTYVRNHFALMPALILNFFEGGVQLNSGD